eukprot:4514104-Karenia_brevis.AAC.1
MLPLGWQLNKTASDELVDMYGPDWRTKLSVFNGPMRKLALEIPEFQQSIIALSWIDNIFIIAHDPESA